MIPPPVPVDLPAIICSYAWPCDQALAVVYGPTPHCPWGESHGEDVVSLDGQYYGPFQLSRDKAATVEELLDPPTNVALAYDLWREHGWGPWGCAPDGVS